MNDDRIHRIPRYARRSEAEAREAERQYQRQQEARRAWQEGDDDFGGHRNERSHYEQAWTHAGRYHPYFGEPRVYGDPFNIEPGYPRQRPQGYTPRFEPRDEERGFLERAGDEVASWFGDSDAEMRRARDHHEGPHRGRGPEGYKRSDSRIEEDVHDQLSDDSWLDASSVKVRVEDGEVTLDGTVDSRSSKRRAEDLCDSVSGVRHCQNNLRVEHREPHGRHSTTGAPMTATSGGFNAGEE